MLRKVNVMRTMHIPWNENKYRLGYCTDILMQMVLGLFVYRTDTLCIYTSYVCILNTYTHFFLHNLTKITQTGNIILINGHSVEVIDKWGGNA